MGMEWSAAGTEALYLKSRVVMAARAAGKRPIGGIWQQVHDLDGLAAFADAERRMGFAGPTILHPSNAPIVHRDRQSAVQGKSVSVRVDLGGRPIIKKKTKN